MVAHRAPSVADGLARQLREQLQLTAVAVTSARPAEWPIDADGRDVAVVDAQLAPDHAAALCRQVVARGIRAIMIVDPGAVNHLGLLEHGAAGLVVPSDGVAGVLDAVRTVMAGHVHVPAHLLGSVLHALIVERRGADPDLDRVASLSPREREVLALLGAGAGTREIADRLVISPYTAKTHINRLLGKLGLASRTEAATFALDHDIRSELMEVTGD
ncbi:helix-turn-helix domain-containing protein [Nocardioides sp. GXQ0305]|uniref:helix-turn-helix transcriptional regulator n=1 Tax=Nocardioides sp. GXQ0305 TaxID=3423912 RepID=UPI003D7D8694